jgi:multidrug efflux pump subunit AcrB
MLNFASRARPFFGAVVLTVALLTAGGVYYATHLPRAVYPEVTFSRMTVVVHVPTLGVANMEAEVTRPLEQAVSTVMGVAQVRSKTIRGGSELSIDFNPGTDMIRAKNDTWNRIGAINSQLPPGTDLTVEQMTPAVNPIMSVILTGGDRASDLRDYAFYQLAPRIKNVPDVLYANVAGGDLREIEIEARPDALLAAGLSAADLADQVGKVARLQPVARVEKGSQAFGIQVNTQKPTARQIEDVVVTTRNNQPLHVRDLADVRVLHTDRVLSIGYDGRDAVVINVFRQLGGNTVEVSRNVRALLATVKHPSNIQLVVGYDEAALVNTSVENVRDAIVVGGCFSILILLLFLKSWRATLISALAIPTTLAITLLLLYWKGETLNLMSLGGLAVAIGLIIDDTVVVIENIARHLAPGGRTAHGGAGARDPVDAASSEITGAVVGSTLTTVLVFVPLAFIVGVYGQFFASLSWALSIAVLVSMVISLTLIPVFAAKFLAGRPMPEPGWIYNTLAHGYELFLSAALRVPWLTLAASLVAVALGVVLYTGVPNPFARQEPGQPPPAPLVRGLQTGLMPDMDEGALTVDYFAPAGAPLARTEEMARDIEKILSENPDVDAYVRRTGAEMGIFATQSNRGDIQVVLRPADLDPVSLLTKREIRPALDKLEKQLQEEKPPRELKDAKEEIRERYRRRPIRKIMEEVEDRIKDKYGEHQLRIETMQIMQDQLADLSGASKPIEIKIFGPDQKVLQDLSDKVADILEEKGKGRGFADVSRYNGDNPDLEVVVNGVVAERFGIKSDEVERQLRTMFTGQVATQVRESSERITDVRIRYPDRVRFGPGLFEPDRLLRQWILLPAPSAGPSPATNPAVAPLAGPSQAVPVSALATVKRVHTPTELWRENQQPAIFITAEQKPQEAGLGAMVADIRRWMNESQVVSGAYHYDIGGHYKKFEEAEFSFAAVLVVAVVLVFIMLAFQFRSVVLPLLIFLTQPLSLVSGFFALWITGTPLNISSGMGMILLVGLDMKNGILLVEYIQQLRAEGMELMPALILAGRTRFRPILMTSLAAILGLLPLALGIGPGAQMQQPLAIMVIGGLTANMLFTRVVIPVGYLVLERRPARPAPVPAKAS